MNDSILEFLKSKRIAVVGISRNNAKFGNAMFRELKSRGYDMVPVHPELETFEGSSCF